LIIREGEDPLGEKTEHSTIPLTIIAPNMMRLKGNVLMAMSTFIISDKCNVISEVQLKISLKI
jgi:hypothetical protein